MLGFVVVAAAAGVGLCRAMHVPADPVEIAAGIGLIAGTAALLPIGFYRGTDPVTRFQMAWIGTILHMTLSAGLGAIGLFALHLQMTRFVVSLLAMYSVTLVGVCAVLIKAMRLPQKPDSGYWKFARRSRINRTPGGLPASAACGVSRIECVGRRGRMRVMMLAPLLHLPALAVADPLEEVLPHRYFTFLGLHLNNQMLMAVVAAVLMLLIFPRLFAKPDPGVPTGAKNLLESILEFLRVEVFRPALKENTDRFVPFLWTMFFFILFCNLLGCIPLAAFFEFISLGHLHHLGGAATASVSTTAALAVVAFLFIHAHGIDQIARQLINGTYGQDHHHNEHTSHGGGQNQTSAHDQEHMRGDALAADIPGDFRALTDPTAHYADGEHPTHKQSLGTHGETVSAGEHRMSPLEAVLLSVPYYLWNFAPHPFRPADPNASWIKWVPDLLMWSFLLVLELLGALIKPFALCMRLFANMVAGHVLLAVLIGLIFSVPALLLRYVIGFPVGLLDIGIQLLELFVAFLQAYIFTFLTTLFLASAVAPEH